MDKSKLDSIKEIAAVILDDPDKSYHCDTLAQWVQKFDDGWVKTALENTAYNSSTLISHGRGIVGGVQAALMSFGFTEREAIWEIIKRLPNNFQVECLPATSIHADADWTFLHHEGSKIVPFKELYDQLPSYTTDETVYSLKEAYVWECALISMYAKQRAKRPLCFLYPFRAGGSQLIAEFEVRDLMKANDPNKVNWHLQNTSQWVYAGAIVVQDGRVSTHH